MVLASAKLFVPSSLKSIDDPNNGFMKLKSGNLLLTLIRSKGFQFLSLDDKISKTCSDIQVKNLNNDNGVESLISKLNLYFQKT